MKTLKYIFPIALCVALACCRAGSRPGEGEGGVRAAIDSLNRQAFELRYKDIERSTEKATRALELIDAEANDYRSARAQALNHLAYSNYLTSRFERARHYIGLVRAVEGDYPGREVEEAITYITEARLFLRECLYAEAFTIYDSVITIFKRPLSRLRHGGNRRYDWARSDYLIGNAVLDYYYRETRLSDILPSLDRVARRERLHIDTTQLSILYYTYAASYERAAGDDVANLYSALDNVEKGLDLVAPAASRNDHGLANLYQITGSIIEGEGSSKWVAGVDSTEIRGRFDRFKRDYLIEKYGWSPRDAFSPELSLVLLLRADSLFRPYDDPYQNLASSLHIGNYYLSRGDTTRARRYFSRGLTFDSLMSARGGSAPIWTARLYNTLLENAPDGTPTKTLKSWYETFSNQKAIIDQNARRDYNTQKERDEATSLASRVLTVAGFILVVCAVVSVLLYFLWKRNRQLRFMQKKLIEQKRMELLTYVVRGISHELSQPLGAITQTLYDTRRDVATLREGRQRLSDERYAEIVGNIDSDLKTITRGKDTIGDLVASFRNTIRDNVTDHETEFNLRARLDDIVKVVRPGIKSNIELEIDCPTDLTVRTYPLLFGQVVTNLVSNADQHAFPDPDSTDNRIRIVCRAADGDLVMKCADNGTGIPVGELEHLRQPFVSKKQTNLGLGLSLVGNIVELYMNGSVTFSSDGGLTVTVTIPDCIVKK